MGHLGKEFCIIDKWLTVFLIVTAFVLNGCSKGADLKKKGGVITHEKFRSAIQSLNTEMSVGAWMEGLKIHQLKIGEKRKFYVAWTKEETANPDLPLLIVFDKQKKTLYMQSFSGRIQAVEYIHNRFPEVSTHVDPGTNLSFNRLQWLEIKPGRIIRVSEYRHFIHHALPSGGEVSVAGQYEYTNEKPHIEVKEYQTTRNLVKWIL